MITVDADRLDDLAVLRRVVRDFLAPVDPHAGIEQGARVDRDLWRRACRELGVAGVDVPASAGGSEIGAAGLAVVQEEAGRTLARVPVLGSVVVVQGVLVRAGGPAAEAWLPRLLDGEAVAAVADRTDPAGGAGVAARATGSGWSLTGRAWPVLDGLSADVLLVVSTTPDGPTGFLVDADAAGVERRACRTLDLTRDAARLELSDVAGLPVGAPGSWPRLASSCAARHDLAVAAEALGSAQACLDAATSYAGERVQFGRVIGSFQAVKHRLAGLAVLVDDARSGVEHASWALDEGSDQAPLAAAIAAAAATRAHLQAAADSVQVHGGIGFTWEHTAHLHLRRAHASALLHGDLPQRHEDVLALLA